MLYYNVYFYRPVVDAMDFPKNYLDNLYSFPLNQVNQINNVNSPYDPPSQNVDQCDSTNIKQTENESRNDSQSESRSEICDTTQSESREQTGTKTESKDKCTGETGTSKQCNKTEGKHGKRKHKDKVNSICYNSQIFLSGTLMNYYVPLVVIISLLGTSSDWLI